MSAATVDPAANVVDVAPVQAQGAPIVEGEHKQPEQAEQKDSGKPVGEKLQSQWRDIRCGCLLRRPVKQLGSMARLKRSFAFFCFTAPLLFAMVLLCVCVCFVQRLRPPLPPRCPSSCATRFPER